MVTTNAISSLKSGELFLTDGGIETSLIFLDGFELPYFAAFDLLKDRQGSNGLRDYYRRYLEIAREYKTGFVLESPTWRASSDWIKKLGYPEDAVFDINNKAIQLMKELKNEFSESVPNIVISGCIGPRGDGYKPENMMTAEEAENYHRVQIEVFSRSGVDIVSAFTMNYVEEAIGIARAANGLNIPVVISFTVETDGKLPGGTLLKDAILQVDNSVGEPPLYYMINCAHPTHFVEELRKDIDNEWTDRIKGLRANASCKSHAELDEATELDRGNPQELAVQHRKLKGLFNHLQVFGGCCGTDSAHVHEIAKQVTGVHA
jgi:S-methylmethionine-dependent homocysteine/selenocysteine methylase